MDELEEGREMSESITKELRDCIFDGDPERIVSVTVGELKRLYSKSWLCGAHDDIDTDPIIHERTCHMLECHEWQDEWEPYGIYCSECEAFVPDWKSKNNTPVPKYCPNCGARVVSE